MIKARKQVLPPQPSQTAFNHFPFPFIKQKVIWNIFADLSWGNTVQGTNSLWPVWSNTTCHQWGCHRWSSRAVQCLPVTPWASLSPLLHLHVSARFTLPLCRRLSGIPHTPPNYAAVTPLILSTMPKVSLFITPHLAELWAQFKAMMTYVQLRTTHWGRNIKPNATVGELSILHDEIHHQVKLWSSFNLWLTLQDSAKWARGLNSLISLPGFHFNVNTSMLGMMNYMEKNKNKNVSRIKTTLSNEGTNLAYFHAAICLKIHHHLSKRVPFTAVL